MHTVPLTVFVPGEAFVGEAFFGGGDPAAMVFFGAGAAALGSSVSVLASGSAFSLVVSIARGSGFSSKLCFSWASGFLDKEESTSAPSSRGAGGGAFWPTPLPSSSNLDLCAPVY